MDLLVVLNCPVEEEMFRFFPFMFQVIDLILIPTDLIS